MSTEPFSLTLTLSRWERELTSNATSLRALKRNSARLFQGAEDNFSLSRRERDGVRESLRKGSWLPFE
jgi:hypothetical protein